MTLLIFVYILGGAMSKSIGNISYVNYVVPGTLLLCIGQCSTSTAMNISADIQKGIIDRFRSMPILRSSVLNGLDLESAIRTTFSFLLTFLVSLLVGFNPNISFGSMIITLGLLVLYTFTITWISIVYGLLVKNPEGAGSLTMLSCYFLI